MKTYYRKETIQAKPMSRRDDLLGCYVLGKNGFEDWHPKEMLENDFEEVGGKI